jgi:hypothetical protein
MPRKQGPETRTGRRFEASACWYNRRVKLSSISLIQLRESHSSRTGEESSLRGPHRRIRLVPRVGINRLALSYRPFKYEISISWECSHSGSESCLTQASESPTRLFRESLELFIRNRDWLGRSRWQPDCDECWYTCHIAEQMQILLK